MPTKAQLYASAADIFRQLSELEGGATAPVDPTPVDPTPVDPTPTPAPTPAPIPAVSMWSLYRRPVLTIPSEIRVPPGTMRIYIPVSVDQCDFKSFYARISRLVNVSGGTINVGTAEQTRANFGGLDKIYHWSPGDDPIHYLVIEPRTAHVDGRAFQAAVDVVGLGDSQKGRGVTIRFDANAPAHPTPATPFHRPLRKLDLSKATRKNTFDPETLPHTPNGANGTWTSALSHGRAQDGNSETGLYADSSVAGAISPISYDPVEDAIRLHTQGYTTPVPFYKNGDGSDRMWRYQAAVLQGLRVDDVCGVEGVWRMEAKIPCRRYSWPAFWLVNRSRSSAGWPYSQWPGEIDVLEKFNFIYGTDTPFTSSFAQHYGNVGSNERAGVTGTTFEVDMYGSPRARLDEVYTSWAVHVEYDPMDTTKSEVTWFVNDMEVGCEVFLSRHQDLNRKIEFYPIFNVAVKTPSTYTPERYNNDDGRGFTGDMLVRDVAYYPTGAAFA